MTTQKINAYAENKGWLFQDIQAALGHAGCKISNYPESDADAWICVRSSELRRSPKLSKTIVQVHNMEPHDIDLFNQAAGVLFCHPMQVWLWQREGFKNRYTIKPIGARATVKPAAALPPRPTLGFFAGEASNKRIKGSELFEKAVTLARTRVDFDCLMIGRNLEHIASLGRWENQAAGVEDYDRIDALFCGSISPGIPLSVYEDCAAGLPVISTPRWFPRKPFPGVHFGSSRNQLSNLIIEMIENRQEKFENRANLARAPYKFEDWIKATIDFTMETKSIRQASRPKTDVVYGPPKPDSLPK